MTSPATPMMLSAFSQRAVMQQVKNVFTMQARDSAFRSRLLEMDLEYYRERDRTQETAKQKLAMAVGDVTKIGNIIVPVVQPQVDNAHAFFVELFLSQDPIFPIVASPEHVDAALQVETLISKASAHFNWPANLARTFMAGLRHNLLALEVDWTKEEVPSFSTDELSATASAKLTETVFAGNKLKAVDLYNLIFDPRVPFNEVHRRGEFVGYSEMMTRLELKRLMLSLDRTMTMNATEAFSSTTVIPEPGSVGGSHYFIPKLVPEALELLRSGDFDWLRWVRPETQSNSKIPYKGVYEVATIYMRLIPRELGIIPRGSKLGAGNPHIYKFIVVNQQVLIYAKRMTNAHDMLPIICGVLNDDGHGVQTKSYAKNATPYQQMASALYNSAITSQRRKVYDRTFYDSSRINKADIDKVDPVARIPVKTDAYGKAISDAIHVVPYRDEGVASILQIAQQVVNMADDSSGSNRVQRGQFQRGNRTLGEFQSVMAGSDARPRASAILLSHGWLRDVKTVVKFDILQYQPPAKLFNTQQQKEIAVNPTDIRNLAWEFRMTDGSSPREQYLQPQLFGQVLQYAGAVPAIGVEWDLAGMFAYQLKAQGAQWVDQFRRDATAQAQFIQNQQQLAGPTNVAQTGPRTV